jgi:hypothetical protein
MIGELNSKVDKKKQPKFSRFKVFFISALLILFNFLASFLVKNYNLPNVSNYSPNIFFAGNLGALILILVVLLLGFGTKVFQKNQLASVLILAGVLSNYFELIALGFVTDYLDFGIAVLNTADLQIYAGIALLLFPAFYQKKAKIGS